MSGSNDIALEMRGIVKEFPGVKALKNVTFSCRRGEVHGLVGENGAGKSTLMKVLSGVHPYPTYEGDIFIKGERARFSGAREAERAGVAIIHQELNLISELTVAGNMFLGREPAVSPFGIINTRKMNADALKYLSSFNIKIDPGAIVKDLSVGVRQMVEIAKALSVNADVLALDEPTSALTETEVESLFKTVRDLKEKDVTMIYISHKLDEIFAICDRVTVLRDGETVGTYDIGELDRDKLVALMVGRDLTNLYPERKSNPGAEALRVSDFSVSHPFLPGEKVVSGASFSARHGEALGISGLMGSGRSELVTSLFGAFPKETSGDVFIDGRKVRLRSPLEAIRNGIGLVTEDRKRFGLVLIMSVGENITLACMRALSKLQWVSAKKERAVIEEYSKELNIKAANSRVAVNTLSGGNQQKVVMAKWLANSPGILILDEPTRGVDVGARFEIYQIVNKLVDSGVCVIMVSSELQEVLGMCDRVLVMCEGKITGEFTREEATQEKIMSCATGTMSRSGADAQK
ncbi:MAG: Ribose import ATP-binding protein RbsA [bacterium ADurb.Bin236]|nr:MAG: Ribose import ATP-binding protein RbsA [bacterium ADurb.Bin236]